jgi:hypothetical protein
MSKQTTQQNSIILPISPNSSSDKHLDFNTISSPSYNIVKSERKTDFIIQKRAKKTINSNTIVSPIKIIKITDKNNTLPPILSSTISNSINNLLSTKQLEPLQVHSVVSKVGQQTKQEKIISSPILQSVHVKTLINTSPSSKISTNKLDEIKFVIFFLINIYFFLFFSFLAKI